MARTCSANLITLAQENIGGESKAPGVILMHMLRSERNAWQSLRPVLVDDYQFAVLNVDLRGLGETSGARDWDS